MPRCHEENAKESDAGAEEQSRITMNNEAKKKNISQVQVMTRLQD